MHNLKTGWTILISVALGASSLATAQNVKPPATAKAMHGSTMSGSVIGGTGHGLSVSGSTAPVTAAPGSASPASTSATSVTPVSKPAADKTRAMATRKPAPRAGSRNAVHRGSAHKKTIAAPAAGRMGRQLTPTVRFRNQAPAPAMVNLTNGRAGATPIRLAPPGLVEAETGRVAGLNLRSKTFEVVDGSRTTPVSAARASIVFHNRRANLYGLMGSPEIHVLGRTLRSGMLQASRIEILDRGAAALQSSRYTRSARPPLYVGYRGAHRRR